MRPFTESANRRFKQRPLELLPPEALVKTSAVDHANWNFRPVLGALQRLRFKLALSLFPGRSVHRLLEVGYGSGIFMPELRRHCEELYGIDLHQERKSILESLAKFNVKAHLFSGSVSGLPFADRFFDGLIAISSLEYVEDLDQACAEVKRVLRSDGFFVVVTPGYSPLADCGLRLLTGKTAGDEYSNRRQHLVAKLQKHFVIQHQRAFPPIGNLLRLYTALRLSPRN